MPTLKSAFSSMMPSHADGAGAMPILPLCSAPSQVGPASSLDAGAATPSSNNSR
jgi:hypothetical protein